MLEIMMGKISEIIIGKLLDEAYGCIKRFFFPKKKYINRLTQIIYKTIEEFEKEQSQKREIGKFPFYHSQILFEKLTKYVLFKKEEIDIDLLIREFNKNLNIVIPTEEELNSFYKLFYANLSKDEELKKLFTEENFQTEIFKISQKLCEVLKLLNDNNKMIKEMHNSIIPPKINLDIKKLDKKDFAYDSSVIEKNIYEPRYIKTSNNDFISFLSLEESGITLSEIVTQKNRVVLLGNAGVGKTTELKMLFEQLWEKREESLNIPMYINLKNFRKSADFEDLIPFAEWKELPITTFILDGLDEIADIQDFISALEIFLNKYKDKKINVVISCRTNIYEKYLVKISGFEYFFLNGLTDVRNINETFEYQKAKKKGKDLADFKVKELKIEEVPTEKKEEEPLTVKTKKPIKKKKYSQLSEEDKDKNKEMLKILREKIIQSRERPVVRRKYIPKKEADRIIRNANIVEYFLYLEKIGLVQKQYEKGRDTFYKNLRGDLISVSELGYRNYTAKIGGQIMKAIQEMQNLSWIEALHKIIELNKEEVAVPEIKTKKSFELLEKIKEENQVKNGENLIRKIARV